MDEIESSVFIKLCCVCGKINKGKISPSFSYVRGSSKYATLFEIRRSKTCWYVINLSDLTFLSLPAKN